MRSVAFILGSGQIDLAGKPLDRSQRKLISSEFGSPSSVPIKIDVGSSVTYLLYRHGESHKIAPHKINYRANMSCLNNLHVEEIIAVNTVGGIAQDAKEGALILPDQLIDYTWGREHTIDIGGTESLMHVDFTEPFDAGSSVRDMLSDSVIVVSLLSDALSARLIDSPSDTVLVPLLETLSVRDTDSEISRVALYPKLILSLRDTDSEIS